ncbi:cell surface protein [Methanosarcinales archaeon]|nr:MAG: cell surface protein [Methanosarcinales archaeon]
MIVLRRWLTIPVFAIVIFSSTAMAGEWQGSGTPLYTIASGSLHGGVYVDGGHGVTYVDPYTEYFDLPDNIIYARLYVPMWNYNKGDTLTVSINDYQLKTREEPDYLAAWGVSCYVYNVTDIAFKKGLNLISASYENNNGAPYAIFLVAVYENSSMPYTRFWIDEGNDALSKAIAGGTVRTEGEALFPGDVDLNTVEKADLWTVMIAGTPGEVDELWFNSRLLGTDIGREKTGGYFDFDHFDVTDGLIESNNTVIFKRGDEQYLHPFNAILVVEHGSSVTGDTKLRTFPKQSSVRSGIPVPVIAVIIILISAFSLMYLKKRGQKKI